MVVQKQHPYNNSVFYFQYNIQKITWDTQHHCQVGFGLYNFYPAVG